MECPLSTPQHVNLSANQRAYLLNLSLTTLCFLQTQRLSTFVFRLFATRYQACG